MPKRTKREFGESLIKEILETFENAYALHATGESLDSLLIPFDIIMAGGDTAPEIIAAHRAAIYMAVDAADKKIELGFATFAMRKQLNLRLNELITQIEQEEGKG